MKVRVKTQESFQKIDSSKVENGFIALSPELEKALNISAKKAAKTDVKCTSFR